ncbi:MAG: hypothetical protein ABSC94_25440, partial [Polyangiaceae bacterium]
LLASLDRRLPATSRRLEDELAERYPEDPQPLENAAAAEVDDLEAGASAPWCERERRADCGKAALAATERLQLKVPGSCKGYALRARARLALGATDQGLRELAHAADSVDDRVACLKVLAQLSRSAGDDERETDTLDKIVHAGCAEDAECAANLAWVAAHEEARHNRRRALALYERAHERMPESTELIAHVARLAAAVGLHAQAADNYERLARSQPENPAWPKAAAAERQAALDVLTR